MKLPKFTKGLAIALVGILLIVSAGVAYAVYTMTSSPINYPVYSQATLVLSVNGSSAVVGDIVHLVATCSDGSYAGVITFLDGSNSIGTALSSGGVAILDYQVNTAKTYSFSATGVHA